MTHSFHRFFILLVLFTGVGTSAAQVQTGTPPFGSFSGGPDVINLGNLNAHLSVSVLNKPGRGLNAIAKLGFDSSIWSPVASGPNLVWQPNANWGLTVQAPLGLAGYLTASTTNVLCDVGGAIKYTNLVFYDLLGTPHAFTGTAYFNVHGCTFTPESFTSTATDGSGLVLTFSTVGEVINTNITWPDGASTNPPLSPTGSASATVRDSNGNRTNYNNGILTDTLGQTALTVSGAKPNPITFSYTSPAGTPASYTISFQNYTVRTNFGCSGVSEYGPTSNSLLDRITLADASFYQFNYEATPGFPGNVTGRLSSVTLPTGGTITYTYSGGGTGVNGITCADGSAATLTRTTPDGSWTYAHSESGTAWTTTITDPQSNNTVIQFHGIYETQRQVYQGSVAPANLLQTANTCYNGSATPCTGTAVTLPITQRSQIIQLPDASGKQCKHDFFYSSFGLVIEVDDYDYGPSGGGVGSLIRKTLKTYAALGNGIVDRPASVTVRDAGGVTKAQTTFTYDETAVMATTGTPQLVSVSGSRGNLTTVKNYKDGTNFLTSTATYFDTGNVLTGTDVNSAQTTFTYGACGNSFPTSISEPLTLSTSATWDCTGGVLTSATDENGKQTSVAYSDPYFWRPASSTDPTGAVTNITYSGQTSSESSLSFNSGNSAVDVLKTVDGLGRIHVQQTRQSPGASSFDSVEQDFDSLGRPNRTTLPYSGTAAQLNPTGPATAKTYDALGRILSVTDAGGRSTTYSYSQNDVVVTVGPAPTGENTKRRQWEYDALGRLASVCEITSASGSGICAQTASQTGYWTKYTYDVLGNLLTVTHNAQAASGYQQSRSYTYDFLSRLTSETNPETGTTSYTYDTDATCGTSLGDTVKPVDAVGNSACIAYDALHRATSVTYSGPYAPNTPNKYFVYDTATVNSVAMANGKTSLVEAYTGTTQNGSKITDVGFSYSARGEVADVYQSTPNSGGYYHLKQTYWANGAPNQLSGNLAALPAFTFGVDGEGRSNSASASSGQNPVTSTLYNVFGQPYQLNFGSLDSDSFGYDSNTGRMTQYQFNVNGQALVGSLTWNANATLQKLVISDPFNSTDNQTCNYGYDDLNRVASGNCASVWSQTFGYDAFGNLTKSGSMSFQPVYTDPITGHNSNRFISIPGATVSYDSNGNVLGDGSHTYTWDADDNSVTVDGVGLTYDALGRMVEQNRSGVYTQIVYGPTGGKLALMNGQNLQNAFLPLPGRRAEAVYTASGLSRYRHKDWLGSARLDSTPTRTVSSTTAYAPFGETYAQSGTVDSSFTGQNQDTVAGLYDFPAREYSTQGRWPSPDPSGLAAVNPAYPQSWNRYAYVLNNPLELSDPLGLYCVDANGNAEEGVNSEAACKDADGEWVTVDGQDTQHDSVTVPGDPPPNDDTTDWGYYVTWTKLFFTNFTVFGPSGDSRPSCFAGFLKDTARNFFGYSGADIVGGVTAEEVIRLPRPQIPRNLRLRGNLTTKAWLRRAERARLAKAFWTGVIANVIVAEGQALAAEIDSVRKGNCK